MIIKKFTAPTMTEALARVREELGTDAIILNTRSERRGGVLDFMGKPMVEVTAAVDKQPAGERQPRERKAAAPPVGPAEARQFPPERKVSYEPPPRQSPPRSTGEVDVKTIGGLMNIDAIVDDIRDLKRSMKTLADSAASGDLDGLPPNLKTLLASMQSSGMDDRIAKRIVRQLLNDMSGGDLADIRLIRKRATDLLLASMGEVNPILFAGAKPRIVAFVGPTGSGKTTTIAKLATEFTLNQGKRVSVLSIDTRRVDAVGQLKAYCRIIDVPLLIAYSPDELPGVMPGIMGSDVTLVDTPGSGPMDRAQMIEMVEFLQRMVPQEVHLAMSVTTSLMEMRRIHENFGLLKPNRVLFTKMDETDHYGTMISFAALTGKPMSYVTFGQNVPGDFALADPGDFIRKALESAPSPVAAAEHDGPGGADIARPREG
jgi:flagellar biosynthesis protein FlhF